jgi:hypothetical protein
MELRLPGAVVGLLRGRRFENFDHFRGDVWKSFASTPELAEQFSAPSVALMRRGLAPKAPPSSQTPSSTIYHLRLLDLSEPYNMDKIRMITPLRHYQIVYYGGLPFEQGDWNIDKEGLKKKLVPIVERLMNDGSLSDDEFDSHMEEFEENVPYPNAADLIFSWSREFDDAAQIVDFALTLEKIPTSSRAELIEVARKLMTADVATTVQSERLSWHFKANVPHPDGDGLIFHPKIEFKTPQELVDHALAYSGDKA